jgi:hypothetical protein
LFGTYHPGREPGTGNVLVDDDINNKNK